MYIFHSDLVPLSSYLIFWKKWMLAFIEIFNKISSKCARKKKAKIPESQSHGVFKWDIEELMFLIKKIYVAQITKNISVNCTLEWKQKCPVNSNVPFFLAWTSHLVSARGASKIFFIGADSFSREGINIFIMCKIGPEEKFLPLGNTR